MAVVSGGIWEGDQLMDLVIVFLVFFYVCVEDAVREGGGGRRGDE